MEKKPITWITKNGKHIPIYDESSDDEKKKEREIAENEEEANQKNKQTQKPTFSGNYKITHEMIKVVGSIAERMQEEFPILSEHFYIEIDKNMDESGMGWDDRIELRGTTLKKYLSRGDSRVVEGLVAHELTHTMQSRLCKVKNIIGEGSEEEYCKTIWDRAIKRFVEDNPKQTEKELNKIMANSYGGGGHSRYGNSAIEKMAVAIQALYSGYGRKDIGKYVAEELEKEMR